MSEEKNENDETTANEVEANSADESTPELLSVLDGTVKEIKAALKATAFSKDELNELLEAEQNGNTRVGVVDAINAILNPEQPTAENTSKRTAKVIKAELEEAEAGPTDIINANLIRHLRAELADLKGKK